jgi:hypothetical protein
MKTGIEESDLSSKDFPVTEEGSNWTVVVFRCPRKKWTETLRNLFSKLEEQKSALIPHYTIRSFEPTTESLIISFRILRKQEHEEAIKSLMDKFMKDYNHEIDPEEGSPLSVFHKWIRHGERDSHWNMERCQTLSRISRFVLEIMKSDTSRDDKEEWTHLFSNMAAVFDLLKVYHSPETILNPDKTQYRVLKYG